MQFEQSDPWVLLAVILAQRPVDRPGIVAAGDCLNHAVMTARELDGGLRRLAAAGYVVDTRSGVVLGPSGEEFMARLTPGKRSRWDAAKRELGVH
jgi:hypothetical protein